MHKVATTLLPGCDNHACNLVTNLVTTLWQPCDSLATTLWHTCMHHLQNEDWDRIFGEAPASKPSRQQQVTTPTATPTHGSSSSTSRPHGGSRSSDHSPERQLRSPRKKELPPHQVPAVAAVMAREGDNPLQSSSDTALLRPPPAHGVFLTLFC